MFIICDKFNRKVIFMHIIFVLLRISVYKWRRNSSHNHENHRCLYITMFHSSNRTPYVKFSAASGARDLWDWGGLWWASSYYGKGKAKFFGITPPTLVFLLAQCRTWNFCPQPFFAYRHAYTLSRPYPTLLPVSSIEQLKISIVFISHVTVVNIIFHLFVIYRTKLAGSKGTISLSFFIVFSLQIQHGSSVEKQVCFLFLWIGSLLRMSE